LTTVARHIDHRGSLRRGFIASTRPLREHFLQRGGKSLGAVAERPDCLICKRSAAQEKTATAAEYSLLFLLISENYFSHILFQNAVKCRINHHR
jgi:hypothetical protein